MRLAAIVLAVAVAIGQLALFAAVDAQLDATLVEQADAIMSRRARTLWALSWSVPWAVAAGLLAWGAPRVGTAVLIALAVLSLSQIVGSVERVSDLLGSANASGVGVVEAAGGLGLWIAGTSSALLAWLARPSARWRAGAPGPGALFTTAALAAWLTTAFRSTAFAPPGAPRRFVEPLATGLDANGIVFVAHPILVALVLITAPRLRREVAGAVTLTFAVPELLSGLATLRTTAAEPFVIPTPAGVLAPTGAAVLVVLGTLWVVRGAREVSAAARGPDRAAAD